MNVLEKTNIFPFLKYDFADKMHLKNLVVILKILSVRPLFGGLICSIHMQR